MYRMTRLWMRHSRFLSWQYCQARGRRDIRGENILYENLMIMMLIESALAGSWNFPSEKEQIERFVVSVQHLLAADKLPLLDAEYWTLLEEHLVSMQLFLPVKQCQPVHHCR